MNSNKTGDIDDVQSKSVEEAKEELSLHVICNKDRSFKDFGEESFNKMNNSEIAQQINPHNALERQKNSQSEDQKVEKESRQSHVEKKIKHLFGEFSKCLKELLIIKITDLKELQENGKQSDLNTENQPNKETLSQNVEKSYHIESNQRKNVENSTSMIANGLEVSKEEYAPLQYAKNVYPLNQSANNAEDCEKEPLNLQQDDLQNHDDLEQNKNVTACQMIPNKFGFEIENSLNIGQPSISLIEPQHEAQLAIQENGQDLKDKSSYILNTSDNIAQIFNLLMSCLSAILEDRFEEAILMFGKAINIRRDILNEPIILALILAVKKEYVAAIMALEDSPKDSPELWPWCSLTYAHWGDLLSQRNETDEALEMFRTAIKINPQEITAYSALGSLLFSQGKYDDVIEISEEIIKLDPLQANGYSLLGKALMERNKLDEALKNFQRVVALTPDQSPGYLYLAELMLRKENFEQAILMSKKALEYESSNINGSLIMATAFFYLGEFKDASTLVDKVLEEDPENLRAIMIKGEILLKENLEGSKKYAYDQIGYIVPPPQNDEQFDRSFEVNFGNQKDINFKDTTEQSDCFSEISSLDNRTELSSVAFGYREVNSSQGHLILANAFRAEGNFDAAISEYEKAYRDQPKDWRYYFDIAMCLEQQGKIDEALLHFKEANILRPQDGDIYYSWGHVLLKQGKSLEAVSKLERAIQLNSRDWNAYYICGQALITINNLQRAVAYFEKANIINPKDARVFSYWGSALLHQGQYAEAIPKLQKAIEFNPNDWTNYSNISTALLLTGNYRDALENVKKAHTLNPNNEEIYDAWGSILVAQGNINEALSKYKKAIEINPRFWKVYQNCSFIFYVQQNYDAAILYIEKASTLNPNEEEKTYLIWGIVLTNQGKYFEALSKFQKAYQINPKSWDNAYNLSKAFMMLGRIPDALAYLRITIRLNPQHPEAQTLWSECLKRLSNFRQALYYYAKSKNIL